MRKVPTVVILLLFLVACNDEPEKNKFLSTEEGRYNLVIVLDGHEPHSNDQATQVMQATNYDNTVQVFTYYSKSHSDLENQSISDEEIPIYLVFNTEEQILKTSSSDEVIKLLHSNH